MHKKLTRRLEHLPRQLVSVEEEKVARHFPHEGRLEASKQSRNSFILQNLLRQPERTDLWWLEALLDVRLAHGLQEEDAFVIRT